MFCYEGQACVKKKKNVCREVSEVTYHVCSFSHWSWLAGQDPMAVERSNLLDVFKLVIKELLDTSLSFGRMLDDTHAPLQQFFVIVDHIFRHGIKRMLSFITDICRQLATKGIPLSGFPCVSVIMY